MKEVEVYRDEGKVDINIIEDFENKAKYKLPSNYKKLLSKHNGLYPARNNFIFEESKKDGSNPWRYPEGSIVFLAFYEYSDGYEHNNIEKFLEGNDDNPLPPHIIIFGYGAGGDMIAFDYRDNPSGNNPKIIFVHHDWFDDDKTEFVHGYYVTELISNSFEEFMDSLFEFKDEDEMDFK